MTDFASSLTRTIARQYDLFQASLEFRFIRKVPA